MSVFSLFLHQSDTRRLFSQCNPICFFLYASAAVSNKFIPAFSFVPLTAPSRLFPSSVAAVRFFQKRVHEEEKVRQPCLRLACRLRAIGGRVIWSMCHTFAKVTTQTIRRRVQNVSALKPRAFVEHGSPPFVLQHRCLWLTRSQLLRSDTHLYAFCCALFSLRVAFLCRTKANK